MNMLREKWPVGDGEDQIKVHARGVFFSATGMYYMVVLQRTIHYVTWCVCMYTGARFGWVRLRCAHVDKLC